MKLWLITICVLMTALSCQEIKDCQLEPSRDFAIVSFYEKDSTEQTQKIQLFSEIYERDSRFFNLSTSILDTLDNDSIITVGLNVLGLPMNPTDSIVNYIFKTDTQEYILTVEYLRHLRIYYDECDPVYSYKLDTSYSNTNGFDSVVVTNKVLENIFGTNIEVYY